MNQYYILARDLFEFNSAIMKFTKGGMSKEQFIQITSEEDLMGVTPGTKIYITTGAPERPNYVELVQGCRARGAIPQAAHTPRHIQEMQEEYEKTKASIINNTVWDAVEKGVNPGRIVTEQIHRYSPDLNRMEVGVGILVLNDKETSPFLN